MAKKILLADDSITIQKVVELTLMDQDYQVIGVSDGDQAVERLEADPPDLVIADVHMPGADGYEVCERAKATRSRVPVILLVGSFEPFDQGKMDRCGAEAHLKKPFDSQELLQIVEDLLRSDGAEDGDPVAGETVLDEVAPTIEHSTSGAAPLEAAEGFATAEQAAAVETPPEDVANFLAGAASAAAEAEVQGNGSANALSDEDVERIAQRVIDSIGERVIREVAWEVIPDLAEIVIRERLKELEGQIE